MSVGPAVSGEAPHTGKLFASLQARAALAGVALELSTDDCDRPVFVASRGPWTITFRSLPEAEALIRVREWVIARTGADA